MRVRMVRLLPAYGPVRNAADAEAAARFLSGARDDWTAVSVVEGRGSSVPLPNWAGSAPPPEVVETQKRLARDAWHVQLQGPQANVGCSPTPCAGTGDIVLDIDAEYGVVLFGIARTGGQDSGPACTPDVAVIRSQRWGQRPTAEISARARRPPAPA